MKSKVSIQTNPRAFREIGTENHGMLRDITELTSEGAKDRSPYLTGNNKDEIKWRQENPGAFIVFTESGYGGVLEIGSSKQAAQPYIRPAYQDAKAIMERRR